LANPQPQGPEDGERMTHHLTLRDGTVLAYRDIGSGPVLLLVHGWAASGIFFEDIAARLADEFRVIIPDLRGHGDTPAGPGRATITDLADDMDELIATLGIAPIIALGWSMGGHGIVVDDRASWP
jgi:pimeloyl-ACP methyl ester carboxylesterase